MDITLLSRMVRDLLQRSDRLSLPSLGSFQFETMDAVFTDKGFAIAPPYRNLTFREEQGGDNLLAECYAEANGIDIAHAKRIISEFCAALKDDFAKSKSIVFPGLGCLRATGGGTVFFVAEEGLEMCPEFDVLEKVSLRYLPSPDEAGQAHTPGTTAEVSGGAAVAAAGAGKAGGTSSAGAENAGAATGGAATDGKAARESKGGNKALLGWLVVLCTLTLAFFTLLATLGRLAPDIIDRILYDGTQIEMINYLNN